MDNISSPNFTHIPVQVNDLFLKYPIGIKSTDKPSHHIYQRIYAARWIPLRYRIQLMRLFKQTHADLNWFFEFRPYWQNILGGRPLWGVEDFYFVKNMYRLRASQLEVPHDADPYAHLAVWQQADTVHQLLHSLTKENVEEGISAIFNVLSHVGTRLTSLLEFGCATASYTKYYLEFMKPQAKVYIADIQTAAFHYAAYRFRHAPNITPIPLLPETSFRLKLPHPVDVILCMAVFEHLNQPLEIVKDFHTFLNPGGLLIFDYVKGEGRGLDTIQGVNQRQEVLNYINQNFSLLSGKLDASQSLGTTVVRKK